MTVATFDKNSNEPHFQTGSAGLETPAASSAAPNGVANGSPNGAINGVTGDKGFIERVASIPVVHDTLQQVHSVIQSNSYSAAAYNKAESLATGVYNAVAPPVQKNLGSQIEAADSYANRGLDYVEKRFPIAFEPSNDIIGKARKPADDLAARFGPLTEQFSTQLSQAQGNLHTVQEKLANVVAGLPRSPKDVQSTVEQVTHSLLQEVEKIQSTVSSSAKDLPANVQSAVQPLFEQLQHAVSDIRTELARTDVPLTTRAANVLTYSRQNTEKALREALERVSALLTKGRNEAEKAVDAGVAKAKEAKAQASS